MNINYLDFEINLKSYYNIFRITKELKGKKDIFLTLVTENRNSLNHLMNQTSVDFSFQSNPLFSLLYQTSTLILKEVTSRLKIHIHKLQNQQIKPITIYF